MALQTFSCPRCQRMVYIGNSFCATCGLSFKPPTPAPNYNQTAQIQKKNNLVALWVVLGFMGLCSLFGAISIIRDAARNKNEVSTTTNSKATSNATPSVTPPLTFAALKKKAEILLNMDNNYVSDLKDFDDVMKPLREVPTNSRDYKEAQALNKKLIDKASVIAAEKIVLGEKPENSAWDGSVRPADRYLKEVLNDYDSAEYLGWTQVSKVYVGKEPYWVTRARMRAKNGFGAYIVKDVVFFIRNNQVVEVEGL